VLKKRIQQSLRPARFEARDHGKVRKAFLAEVSARFSAEAFAKILSATQLMEESHLGQFRKGTDAPYAIHPYRVALSLLEEFGKVDSELICAALLHDTLEDSDIGPEVLSDRFGPRCANLVATLTRQEGELRDVGGDRPDGKYLQRVVRAGDDAVLLKLADKLDNLRDAIYHPNRARVNIFVSETFSAYVPLARSISDPLLSTRAEKLLLEAAAQTGDPESPEFLAALLDSMRYSLTRNGSETVELKQIALPGIAAKLYLYLNPDARYWVDSDGTSLFATKVPHLQLAIRIAQSLRDFMVSSELELLLNLAGLPAAFASSENRRAWKRAALHLVHIQRLLRDPNQFLWFRVLTLEPNFPLLLALIQSRIYLPASWRSPLWAEDLGSTLSRRGFQLSSTRASLPLSRVLSARLALTRYMQGSGTLFRTESLLAEMKSMEFSPAALWSLRITSEYLETQTESSRPQDSMSELQSVADLENLWRHVETLPFESSSLPARGQEIVTTAGLTDVADVSQIETTGLAETVTLFETEKAGEAFRRLLRRLIADTRGTARLTWFHFDALEWKKRRAFWSTSKILRDSDFSEPNLEEPGVLLGRQKLQDCEVIRILPARRFALQDRLPELKSQTLEQLAQAGFASSAMFDHLLMDHSNGEELWLPRIYRVLDTIEDLDSENVQTISVSYDGPQNIPPLTTYLPLPRATHDPKQQERKRFIARYLVAQIYTCAVVRWVRRVTFSCAAVNEAQSQHAFTEAELSRLVSEIEHEYGYHPAYANYIERYGYDPFHIAPSLFASEKLSFGTDQIKEGVYLGIDIGGSLIKFELFKNGTPFQGSAWPSLETPKNMEVSEFCRAILLHCHSWLLDNGLKWIDVNGVGISWPGAVKKNRLAGASGVLRGLKEHGVPFRDDDPINRLPSLQLASYFRSELACIADETGSTLDENLALAIQNDGDAEALGNHALRLTQGEVRKGGKIFVKLGTSVAGGRITGEGAVAEEVGEYAKVILNLNTPADSKWPGGTARYYASAVGVRQLSRTFLYEDEPLFGTRNGLNEETHPDRIEPVELGMLLDLFAEAEGREDFLKKLVVFDNRLRFDLTQETAAALAQWLENTGQEKLLSYIAAREKQRRWPAGSFQSSLDRTIWLCTGHNPAKHPTGVNKVPPDFPFAAMARTVVGTVCLFSQLALQLAHLIAQLYNIYRRGVFSEVILSGGVISGETGEVIEGQTKAFLNKYYDKIYGLERSLGPGAVARAVFAGVSNAGVFGAALAANRMRQVALAKALAQMISYRLKQCEIGEEIRIDELIAFPSFPQSPEVGRSVVESAVMAGSFVWINPNLLLRIS
jgi:hypothetical protein